MRFDFISDRPIEFMDREPLGFATRAKAIARLLRNGDTQPPLTLSVNGPWGTGKSSLLNLIREEMRACKWPTVWFNAWHHQSEDDLLAALLQRIGTAVPPWWQPRGLVFHGRLLAIRLARRRRVLSLLAGTIVLISGFLATNLEASVVATMKPHVPSLEDIWKSIRTLWLWLLAATPVLGLSIALVQLLSKGRTLSGRVGHRELVRKRDFRTNIAADFRDIAQAFKPRTLTILVDDLDRCRPKVMVNLLEAIGFLISSFDCFIIVGMARDYVERNVSLELRNRDELLLDAHAEGTQIGDEQARKMHEFSNQYLNKLFNIEIALPAIPAEQAFSRLVDASLRADKVAPHPGSEILGATWLWLRGHAGMLKLTLVLLVALWAGVYLGDVIPLSPTETPAFSFGKVAVSWFVAAWFLTIAVVAMLAGGYMIARLSEPRFVIYDSDSFTDALRIWMPVIFQFDQSPRAIKQFLIELRLWANQMEALHISMPEASVVALTALRRLDHQILAHEDIDRSLTSYMNTDEGLGLREVLTRATEDHRNKFGDWPPSAEHVTRFREVTGEIPFR